MKNNRKNWFNEYQKVEDYMIDKLGTDKYIEVDFSKCISASDSTKLIIDKLLDIISEQKHTKQQIIDAYDSGDQVRPVYIDGEDYYEKTFNSK